ncbi:hypothetical protein l11_21670 [Neisseria weaveri LMG 5135]|nr:hypothetical protein l11_21670 [Neisseria weaveri LMG 5135]
MIGRYKYKLSGGKYVIFQTACRPYAEYTNFRRPAVVKIAI